jgi:hypothetical protein
MTLLTRALSGNYVNFGVFALYGDRALSDCLEVIIKLCLSIPPDQIMVRLFTPPAALFTPHGSCAHPHSRGA